MCEQKHSKTYSKNNISLTEVSDLIGFSVKFKEGNTQKHTQSVNRFRGQPAADRKSCFIFTRFFCHKSQNKCFVFGKAKSCNGKTKGLASSYPQKRFLATLYKVFWANTQYNLSKIIIFKRKHNKTNDLATFWTENTINTIDTYNRHLQ